MPDSSVGVTQLDSVRGEGGTAGSGRGLMHW